jgi:hypothetical protein
MVLGKFPDSAKPSGRLLRETAQRLGLGRRWGRTFYLTEAEADTLLLAGARESRPYRNASPALPSARDPVLHWSVP